jgi:hypothetical protein
MRKPGSLRPSECFAMTNPQSPIPLARIAYSIDEFHQVGGPCRATTYDLIRTGKLRAVKRGKRTLILATDAQAYFNALAPLVLS